MITNFRVSCVMCGFDDTPATYVVVVQDDGSTVVYCDTCAWVAEVMSRQEVNGDD